MSTLNGETFKCVLPKASKLSEEKLYNYIKKIEVDGLPRIRAYAEAIDPVIYQLEPLQAKMALDRVRELKIYSHIKENVLAEKSEWQLRNSTAIQDKAVSLLSNLIDKANEIATKPDADAKDLNVAVSTLKTIMPAFQAMGATKEPVTDKKARAEKFIC